MLNMVNELRPDLTEMLSKLSAQELRNYLLRESSFHHTSKMYNKTAFYSIRGDIDNIKAENIPAHQAAKKSEPVIYNGNIDYIEWGGTQKHPKANKKRLENVLIEERGSFYVVKNENGEEILRKKIGSNGTYVENIDAEIKRAQEKAAFDEKRAAEVRESSSGKLCCSC